MAAYSFAASAHDRLWHKADMAETPHVCPLSGGMDMSDFRMIPAGMGLMMPATAPWTTTEFAFVFVMWAVMMIGMMTPSVAPMLLIYARVGREAAQQGKPLAASAYFAAVDAA
jgi:predicted metal-binding membrane protein